VKERFLDPGAWFLLTNSYFSLNAPAHLATSSTIACPREILSFPVIARGKSPEAKPKGYCEELHARFCSLPIDATSNLGKMSTVTIIPAMTDPIAE